MQEIKDTYMNVQWDRWLFQFRFVRRPAKVEVSRTDSVRRPRRTSSRFTSYPQKLSLSTYIRISCRGARL